MTINVGSDGIKIFLANFIKMKTIPYNEILHVAPTKIGILNHGIKRSKNATYFALGYGSSAVEVSTKKGHRYIIACKEPQKFILAVERARSIGLTGTKT